MYIRGRDAPNLKRLMTNQKPKTEKELREWIRTLIKEVKEEKEQEQNKGVVQ